MSVRDYSTTPADNNSAPPNGAPEGMAPGGVNNVIRQVMADIRETFEALPFLDLGHTATRVDADTFTIAADLTSLYTAGRSLKLVGATTEYATIESSSYSAPDMTVEVSGTVPTSLSTVSLGVPGSQARYDRTQAEIDAGVTPVNYAVDVTDYGDIRRYFTGTMAPNADVTTAVQTAIDTNCGTVKFPPYPVAVTSGYTCSRSVHFIGLSGPPGGTGSENHPFATILKQFSGDLFTFTGSDGATDGSGGGVQNLRLVQDSGSSVTANGAGTAIKLTGASTSSRPSWVKVDNVIIEYAPSRDSWTWGIDCDGDAITGSVISDLWFSKISTHTASSNGGAMRLTSVAAKVFDCAFYDTHGHVTVTGISGTPSSGVVFSNTEISGTLALDWVNDFSMIGGVATTLTNTANTTGQVIFARIVNAFTNNAGRFFGYVRHSTQNFATCPGSFRFSQQILLENIQYLASLNAAGSSALRLIGMNASDQVVISVDGSDIKIGAATTAMGGGAAPTLGTIGGSGPGSAGQSGWQKFIDASGNAYFVPYWR